MDIEERVIASIASIKGREEHLRKAVSSISPQVDELRLHLEKGQRIEDVPDNVRIKRSRWPQDGRKFDVPQDRPAFCLTCDDDLIYPADYVEKAINAIERYDRKAVISYQGRVLPGKGTDSYYRDRRIKIYGPFEEQRRDRTAHIPGTGVMAWHTTTVRFEAMHFEPPNMADLHAAYQMATKGVPLIVPAHPKGWLLNQVTASGIHKKYRDRDQNQTKKANAIIRTLYDRSLGE